ncbi:sugar phosphate isomerase/epimerase family protein [Curtobacterium sp. 22159]|uniref:sugar phosphate isomerase/epimerase family protein n=1 Tax=Curtobacterium sp. 22159 TaxID=3453882 RepID=UPI003F82E35A
MNTAAHPRLSLNQATVKHATLSEVITVARSAGIGALGTWREPVHDVGLDEAARMVSGSGLRISSHCRGGFFTAPEGSARRAAMDDNRRAIEETATLAQAGAPGSRAVLVLVAGGLPDDSTDLASARGRVADALDELVAEASAAGVQLAIEPLHPMYAADRAVVSTLGQALDLSQPFDPATVGVVVDSFHVWWDPELFDAVARAGHQHRIASYQVSDWLTPIAADALLSRGVMGDGHIDFGPLSAAVDAAGYTGDVEVEVFNQDVWDAPAAATVARVVDAFAEHVPVADVRPVLG